MTDIPLKPHKRNVDVYLMNEKPFFPYYKVKIVEVTANANAGYNEMLNDLKVRAQSEGLDGLVLMDTRQETRYADVSETVYLKDTSTSISRQVATPYLRMSAVGLKYPQNITYVDSIIKKQHITIFSGDKQQTQDVDYDWRGNVINPPNSVAFKTYYNYIARYDIQTTFRATGNDWVFYEDPYTKALMDKKFSLSDA